MKPKADPSASVALSSWIQEQLIGLQFKLPTAKRLALGCFSVVLEHHRAIAILADREMHSSAFALLRPAYDALMRGYWFEDHASEEEIKNVMGAGDPPSTNKIVVMVEGGGRVLPPGFSARQHKAVWAALCDFTHGGIRQIARQFSADVIKPAFPDQEVRQTLWYADTFAFLAGASVAEIGDHEAAKQTILARAMTNGAA